MRNLFPLPLLLVATSVLADDVWTLTRSDFTQKSVRIKSMDSHGLQLLTATSQPSDVGNSEILRLSHETARLPSASTLFTVTGDRIRGELTSIADDKVLWKSALLGDMTMPIDNVRAISKDATPAGLEDERKEDQVVLGNKDTVRGVVAGMADGKISVQNNDETSMVSMASAVTVFFVSPLNPPAATPAFRVRFADGSRLTTPSLRIQSGQLKLQTGETPRSIDLEVVAEIEQVNGPVVWLSSLKPTVNEQVSFFSETPLPARMDRNVFGKPMRFNSQTFDRGVGVHANSRLVFALDGSFKTFRTRYAIDTTHAAEIANVTVRILLDDKTVHEEKHFRADRLSPVIAIPLDGAKSLTLEVIANETIDAQDRLNWLDAALLRK